MPSVSPFFNPYDIQLDENPYPVVTSNTQLPPNHIFPESSEFWFRRELIKARTYSQYNSQVRLTMYQLYCFQGTIKEAVAITFLPPELRANPGAERAYQFVGKLVSLKDNLRKSLIIDTMIPLVLYWCKVARFASIAIDSTAKRNAYWQARLNGGRSVVGLVAKTFRLFNNNLKNDNHFSSILC